MPVNDAPDLYSMLSVECREKIMLGHNCTSPLLFGIANTSTGFSSNSDELQDSFALFNNMVIKPMQELLTDAFDEILVYNGISLNLYFKTLKPLEFIDIDVKVGEEELEEETGVELSAEDAGAELIALGEDASEDWLLIDEHEVDYDLDDEENTLLSKEIKLSFKDKLVNLVSTGYASPNSKSKQDEIIDGIQFITRYVFAGGMNGGKTDTVRPFCANMVAAKKIYRKEDIVRMEQKPVNRGWGPKGSNFYSIWLWKGGGNCYHRWNKQIYVSFAGTKIDVRSKEAKRIAGAKAAKYGYVIDNDFKVSKRPIDMKDRGFLPSNKRR